VNGSMWQPGASAFSLPMAGMLILPRHLAFVSCGATASAKRPSESRRRPTRRLPRLPNCQRSFWARSRGDASAALFQIAGATSCPIRRTVVQESASLIPRIAENCGSKYPQCEIQECRPLEGLGSGEKVKILAYPCRIHHTVLLPASRLAARSPDEWDHRVHTTPGQGRNPKGASSLCAKPCADCKRKIKKARGLTAFNCSIIVESYCSTYIEHRRQR